jgi:hypothetical protein
MLRLSLFLIIVIIATPEYVNANTDKWNFALGYSFLSNVDELKDTYKHLSVTHGDGSHVYNLSVGIIFNPYRQYSNGIRIGPGVGPLILLLGDAHHVEVPVNMTIGYSFFSDANYSPYLKTGISYHIASGDYLADSTPGFYGGLGIEIFNQKRIHLGIEAAYDAAVIKTENQPGSREQKIKTGELTLYIYADF